MKITEKLSYGVAEDTPKELLYVKRIILRNYKEPKNIQTFLEIMSNFKIFQYNYNKAIDSDYFMWQYVDDNGNKDWTHVDLSCYQDSIKGIFKMWNLYEICKTTYTDIEAEIQFDDIRNLVNRVEEVE